MHPSEMTPPAPRGLQADDALRAAMQRVNAQAAPTELTALQDRVLAQWAQRDTPATLLGTGPLGVLNLGSTTRRMQWGLLAAIIVAAVGMHLASSHTDPTLEELLEPDVLSLIAMGEL